MGRKVPSRADFGAPVKEFFERQPPGHRAILEELRRMVMAAAPEAESSLKWGMPWFSIGGKMLCSLGAHKAHVNLILMGPPEAFPDPQGLLLGTGRSGRHLRIERADQIPRGSVKKWLRAAVELAKKGGK